MDNIYFYIKESIRIFINNRRFLYPSFIIICLVLYSSLFHSKVSDFVNTQNDKENKPVPVNLRNLEEEIFKKENITLFYNELKSSLNDLLKINLTEAVTYYDFIHNITMCGFYGEWDKFYVKKNKFKEKEGDADLGVFTNKGDNYLINLGQKNTSNLSIYFQLKDGEYSDDFIEGNFTLNFDNFSLIENLEKDNFSIIIKNTSISYAYGHYIELEKRKTLNNTFINITFYKKQKMFENKMQYQLSSTSHSRLSVYILSQPLEGEKDLEISFSLRAYGSYRYSNRILNYSIALTLLSLIEIYYTTKFLIIANDNNQIALNIDMITIFSHIMWSSLICGVNFYFSFQYQSRKYEYGMPSVSYFSLFSIFLLRLVFISWKARNIDLLFRNIREFRKKLFRFYLFFYCVLFLTLISVQIWYTYFFFTFILFLSTWLFQIIYSARKGTKPPMPYKFIFFVSLFKMLIPIYLKAYSNNIFNFKPNYLKVFIVDIVVLIEAVIVSLQKLIGPKFFIPRRLRKQAFDYYKDPEEIPQNAKEQECVICLDNLEVLEPNSQNEENKIYHNFSERLTFYIEKLTKKKNSKAYMITPCSHIFHSKCLEMWLDVKNECPYCRQKIPPLDI